MNPTETTIKLYEILEELCEKYGEFEAGLYSIYLADFNIEIYVDNVLIEYIDLSVGNDVIFTGSIYWPAGGEIRKNGEVLYFN